MHHYHDGARAVACRHHRRTAGVTELAALAIDGGHDRAVQPGHGRVAAGTVVGDRREQSGPVGRSGGGPGSLPSTIVGQLDGGAVQPLGGRHGEVIGT